MAYKTVIAVIGSAKNSNVDSSKEYCNGYAILQVKSTSTLLMFATMMSSWVACGIAQQIDAIQIKTISLITRVNLLIVCDKNGWQIAT